MSTRAHITIKQGDTLFHMSHHCDGYPSGVGCELVDMLKSYASHVGRKAWTASELCGYIGNQDDEYRQVTFGVRWDQEYIYVIDCDNHTLKGYHKGITSPSEESDEDNLGYGDPLFIEDNIFDGRKLPEPEATTTKRSWRSSLVGIPRSKPDFEPSLNDNEHRLEIAKTIFPIMLDKMGENHEIEEVIKTTIDATDLFIKALEND